MNANPTCRRHGTRWLPLLAALFGLPALAQSAPAAAPDATVLELKYDWNTRENTATPQTETCPLRVLPALDERQNKETLGANLRGALLSGGGSRWVTDGLVALKQFGFPAEEAPAGAAATDGAVAVRATLTRAYTWHIGIKIFSMVAMKVQFSNKDGVLQEKHYRAHGDKTNMWGADSEYVTTLNYGLNNLLPVVAQDLVALCKGRKVEPYSYAGPDPAPKK